MTLSSLNPAEQNEFAKAVVSMEIEKRFPSIGYMELMLSANCNLRCDYCFVKRKRSEDMTLDIMRRSINLLARSSKNLEDVGILFFGGEPLLCFDLIKKTIRYARKVFGALGKTVKFDMTTNGTLLDEVKCQYLSKEGVNYLLSIDGDREDHDACRKTLDGGGSFDLTMSNFKIMKSYQPWQGTRLTVAPEKADRICHNVKSLFKMGINQFIIGPAHGAGWNNSQIEKFEEQMYRVFDFYLERKLAKRYIRIVLYEQGSMEDLSKRYKDGWGCGAGRGRLCVTPDGSLYGCSKLATINGVGKGVLRLGDIWHGFSDFYARSLLCDGTNRRRHKCRSCSLSVRCTGNCPATNYAETGNIFESGPESCSFACVYDRISSYASKRLKEVGKWENKTQEEPTVKAYI